MYPSHFNLTLSLFGWFKLKVVQASAKGFFSCQKCNYLSIRKNYLLFASLVSLSHLLILDANYLHFKLPGFAVYKQLNFFFDRFHFKNRRPMQPASSQPQTIPFFNLLTLIVLPLTSKCLLCFDLAVSQLLGNGFKAKF